MQKNSLIRFDNTIYRVLEIQKDTIFIIDCIKRTMPKWVCLSAFDKCAVASEQELQEETAIFTFDIEELNGESKRYTHEHFTLISAILPFVSDIKQRNKTIAKLAETKGISKQTIRYYLCLFLSYQDISVLTPKRSVKNTVLTVDEKNMRWALNKFFYNKNQNSLNAAYTLLLKEKYCDGNGVLLPDYPSFYQLRYFYRKTRTMQNYYISRDGIKDYQKNHRPLLGEGVQEFASHVGIAMLDATVCDIYLVNDSGNLIGRPILTACIDAYSGLCCGYSLSWEGGTYSLRGLMLNVIADKQEHCQQFGIFIQKADWDCDKLPATLVTDMGSEYIGMTFEQIAELGVTLVNLPAYRPELKGSVEKFFDLVQGYFKPYLKGKGVIEPDYQERGSHDYRKDACLTMNQFEAILLRCIIYYNTKRVIENYPYTVDMVQSQIQPVSAAIWNYGLTQSSADLILVEAEKLILTLLPRTQGKFSRNGLKVNKMRYKHENYTEKYLSGGTVTVAYNPDDVSYIWLLENGSYIRFELIESRFKDMDLSQVEVIQNNQKELVRVATEPNLQAQIELANHIEAIVNTAASHEDVDIKGVRKNRQRERDRNHVDYIKKGGVKNA